jgi:hypothetical protein
MSAEAVSYTLMNKKVTDGCNPLQGNPNPGQGRVMSLPYLLDSIIRKTLSETGSFR